MLTSPSTSNRELSVRVTFPRVVAMLNARPSQITIIEHLEYLRNLRGRDPLVLHAGAHEDTGFISLGAVGPGLNTPARARFCFLPIAGSGWPGRLISLGQFFGLPVQLQNVAALLECAVVGAGNPLPSHVQRVSSFAEFHCAMFKRGQA
jgi:hypothetical protein